MTPETVTCRREELYKQVWAEPVRTVAKRYCISDVGLAKICRKLCIPLTITTKAVNPGASETPRRRFLFGGPASPCTGASGC